MTQEIERRWLIQHDPPDLSGPGIFLEQVYVVIDDVSGREKRLRRRVENNRTQYQWTEKLGLGLVRDERKWSATPDEFALISQTAGIPIITKRLYEQRVGQTTIEIHVFSGSLAGLTLIEIEFVDQAVARAFQPLPWFGREVTDDPRFNGRNLARYGLPLAWKILQQFNQPPELSVQYGLATVTQLLSHRRQPVTIVGVAGGTASGKTSQISAGIARAFPGQVLTITQDDYYRGTRALKELQALQSRTISWDEPSAVDLELLARHLRQLRQGQSVAAPKYDFPTSERVGQQTLQPQSIVVVEGLYVLHDLLWPWLDLGLYVEVDLHGQIIRRLLRDITRKGKAPNDILHYLATTVVPMHRQFVAVTKPKADIVMRNDYRPESETARRGSALPQVKIRHWPLIGHLTTLNAEHIATFHQGDQYFTANERDLGVTGESLRIRDESGHLSMTYKGPLTGSHGERFVFTCSIEPETVQALLQHYRSTLVRVDKLRRLYLIPGALVALDEVRLISPDGPVGRPIRVTEVRQSSVVVPDQMQPETILRALGFDPALAVPYSYYDLALHPSLLPSS